MCKGPAGLGRTPSKEFWLYGSKGTLHLDLDQQKLSTAIKDKGQPASHACSSLV